MINYQIGKLYKLSYQRSIYGHELYRNYLGTAVRGQIVVLLKQEKLSWSEWAFKILTSNGIVGWIKIEATNNYPPFKEIEL
jgi:hypothetical protein